MTKYATALLFAWSLHAQSDSIFINGLELKTGMRKADVLSLLAERNDLVKVKGIADAWCVKFKTDHATQANCGTLIQFREDKLTVVSKTLGSAKGEEAAAMIATLFSTLDALSTSGRTELAFSTQEFETDDQMRIRILSFITGSKKYTLTTSQPVGSTSGKTSSVELTESFIRQSERKK